MAIKWDQDRIAELDEENKTLKLKLKDICRSHGDSIEFLNNKVSELQDDLLETVDILEFTKDRLINVYKEKNGWHFTIINRLLDKFKNKQLKIDSLRRNE